MEGFQVLAPDLSVSVVGTHFQVEHVIGLASRVSVQEGKVRVQLFTGERAFFLVPDDGPYQAPLPEGSPPMVVKEPLPITEGPSAPASEVEPPPVTDLPSPKPPLAGDSSEGTPGRLRGAQTILEGF
jgi:hypothetical protein